MNRTTHVTMHVDQQTINDMRYRATFDQVTGRVITAVYDDTGSVTIQTADPETLRAFGRLMIEAADAGDQTKAAHTPHTPDAPTQNLFAAAVCGVTWECECSCGWVTTGHALPPYAYAVAAAHAATANRAMGIGTDTARGTLPADTPYGQINA